MAEKFVINRLTREEVKFKGVLYAGTGAGKTVSSLLLAYGLCKDWSKIVVIDTEHDRAKQCGGQVYSGTRIPQDQIGHVSFAPPYSPERLTACLQQVEEEGEVEVAIVDSLSHFWNGSGGILEIVDKSGGGPAAWKVATPKLRKLVDVLCYSGLHVLMTLRSKQEYEIDAVEDGSGKQKIKAMRKIGTAPQFRPDTIDYEATVAWNLLENHDAKCDKDNTSLFADQPLQVITVETGERIAEWCAGAVCRIGSAEWVAMKLRELKNFNGSIDALANLWRSIAPHRVRIEIADFAALVAAKDEGKARLKDQS